MLASSRFKMATGRADVALDELVCFLSNPLFQVPVLSFMESKCLIFDPNVEDSPAYRDIHGEYKKLVDLLLEGFRADTGLTLDQIIQATKDLNSKPDLRDIFQVLLEQVLAIEDYSIFVHIMAQTNLELQHQALLLISQMMGGILPESLVKEVSLRGGQYSTKDEDQVLMAVLVQSKEEFEKQKRDIEREEEELQLIIGLSQGETVRLQESLRAEQDRLSQTIEKSLSLKDQPLVEEPTPSTKPALTKSASIPPPGAHQPKRQSSTTCVPKQTAAQATTSPDKAAETSAEAAAAWLKNAETEVNTSDAHSQAIQAAVANMSGLTEEEYKKRAEYLRLQRDKLMEMKRKEREKQLILAEKSQPQRPASAQAARAALQQEGAQQRPQLSPEEEKKLAMRKAIAERIKSELMGGK